MSIEIQCMTEKLIVITIKLDYLKVPSKSTMPTSAALRDNFSFVQRKKSCAAFLKNSLKQKS